MVPSGKQTVCYWKWPIEIVDLPMKKCDFPIVMLVYQRVTQSHQSFFKPWQYDNAQICQKSFYHTCDNHLTTNQILLFTATAKPRGTWRRVIRTRMPSGKWNMPSNKCHTRLTAETRSSRQEDDKNKLKQLLQSWIEAATNKAASRNTTKFIYCFLPGDCHIPGAAVLFALL